MKTFLRLKMVSAVRWKNQQIKCLQNRSSKMSAHLILFLILRNIFVNIPPFCEPNFKGYKEENLRFCEERTFHTIFQIPEDRYLSSCIMS